MSKSFRFSKSSLSSLKGSQLDLLREKLSHRDYTIKRTNEAIDNDESPVEDKFARKVIVGTTQEEGAQTFWLTVIKLPLQNDRIVAWKFCHVLHKLLREGHPQVIGHSQMHKGMLEELGKSWRQSQDAYGRLIQYYTDLLVTKLDFHRRNPLFLGNLYITDEELKSVGKNDINNYFQLSVEMFDYLDAILTLQSAVFGSLDSTNCTSTMSSGHCRLAPLVLCIQDSLCLYDDCIKILFWLHSILPPETLTGQRERFLRQYKFLKEFYINANNIQYLRNLIKIPVLFDDPPNFLIQAELRTLNVEPSVPTEEELSDESDDFSVDDFSDTTSTYNDDFYDSGHGNDFILPELLAERDSLMQQLENEVTIRKEMIERCRMEFLKRTEELINKIAELKTDLDSKNSELTREKQLKDIAVRQAKESRDKIEKLKTDLSIKNWEIWQESRLKETSMKEMQDSNFHQRTEELLDRIAKLEAALAIRNIELRHEKAVKEDLLRCKEEDSKSQKQREELNDKIAKLEKDIAIKNSIILQERNLKEDLMNQMEERTKTTEERLKKLNDVYSKLKEELKNKIEELQTDLVTKNSELLQERLLREDLLRQADGASKYNEYEKIVKTLKEKFKTLKDVYMKSREEHIRRTEELSGKIAVLEMNLSIKVGECLQERQLKEDLLMQTGEPSKYHEYEKRAKTMEEKFQKLKHAYLKLREEHIQLIRTKAEVDKQLIMAKQSSECAARIKEDLFTQSNILSIGKSKTDEASINQKNTLKLRVSELKQMFENGKAIKN